MNHIIIQSFHQTWGRIVGLMGLVAWILVMIMCFDPEFHPCRSAWPAKSLLLGKKFHDGQTWMLWVIKLIFRCVLSSLLVDLSVRRLVPGAFMKINEISSFDHAMLLEVSRAYLMHRGNSIRGSVGLSVAHNFVKFSENRTLSINQR